MNAIAPVATSSERNRAYDSDYDKKWGAVIPSGRVAQVEDYVGPCVFLASDDSRFVTGEALVVDGGLTAIGPDMWRRSGIAQEARAKKIRMNRGSTGEASTSRPFK